MAIEDKNRGLFTPMNPSKYVGDPSRIRFRSSWERIFMQRLDENPAVTHWVSEPFEIPYVNPLWSDRISHYVPDFLVQYIQSDGRLAKLIVEIKPTKQSVPVVSASQSDQYARIVNGAKWKAASSLAAKHGAAFRVLTVETTNSVASARLPANSQSLCSTTRPHE